MSDLDLPDPHADSDDAQHDTHEPRLWKSNGWIACVIKNDDDEGWAVSMTRQGDSEPALVGPWTMGRDKKNPKPLDVNAFNTLVKTANEVLRRHEQQRDAQLHKLISVTVDGLSYDVTLDIEPDDDDPYALLATYDVKHDRLIQVRVSAGFKLTRASASAWIANDCRRPE